MTDGVSVGAQLPRRSVGTRVRMYSDVSKAAAERSFQAVENFTGQAVSRRFERLTNALRPGTGFRAGLFLGKKGTQRSIACRFLYPSSAWRGRRRRNGALRLSRFPPGLWSLDR